MINLTSVFALTKYWLYATVLCYELFAFMEEKQKMPTGGISFHFINLTKKINSLPNFSLYCTMFLTT